MAPADYTSEWKSRVAQWVKEYADPEQLQATGTPASHISQIMTALQAATPDLAQMQPCCDGIAALTKPMLQLMKAEMEARGLSVPGYGSDTDSETASDTGRMWQGDSNSRTLATDQTACKPPAGKKRISNSKATRHHTRNGSGASVMSVG
jgi:hypothetical protein